MGYGQPTRNDYVIGRHRLFTVDVCGTLWDMDNQQEMTT